MKKKHFNILFILLFFGLTIRFYPYFESKVINSDLYGRMIEEKEVNTVFSPSNNNKDCPIVKFIIHKYLPEENAVEASITTTYYSNIIFDITNAKVARIKVLVSDGFNNTPLGIHRELEILDSTDRKKYGFTYTGNESERFVFPVSPSVNGYPFDELTLLPMPYLFINNNHVKEFKFVVQKRLSGRIIEYSKQDNRIISLVRTSSETYLVLISSIIFILITLLLTYAILKAKYGLTTTEEIVAVAGYLLATSEFREVLGFSRINGICALEILVILVPLILITVAIGISVIKGQSTHRKNPKFRSRRFRDN